MGRLKSIPTTAYEEALQQQGYQYIAGADEVGRGAWAGPVVGAAVIMPLTQRIDGVRDSKKVSSKKRTELAERIKEVAVSYAIAYVERTVIDEIGIGPANKLALYNAIQQLHLPPDAVLIDAVTLDNLPMAQQSIIRGDAQVYSIAAASIIAKVARDSLMVEYHATYPHYAFHENKGYGTATHQHALELNGVCAQHRLSFHPMSTMV